VEIKELVDLIKEETAAEERVRKAKEEAQEIVRKAREKADSIVQALDSDSREADLRQSRREEIERKKVEIAEEYKQKISELNMTAEKNFANAVALVVKETLKVKI